MHPGGVTVTGLDMALVCEVAHRMRASDRAEIGALCWWGAEAPQILAEEAVRRSGFGGVVLDGAGLPQVALGAMACWPGVYSVWMFATDAWPEVWRGTLRYARQVLRPALIGAGAHRAQCFAAAEHAAAHRLLARLGFVAEGRARGFGRDGEDFVLFGAVR